MDVVKVDLEKSRDMANQICCDMIRYLKDKSLNMAEVIVAINEVSYRFSTASKIPPDSPSLKPVRTPIA